jgi:hypothetical protein
MIETRKEMKRLYSRLQLFIAVFIPIPDSGGSNGAKDTLSSSGVSKNHLNGVCRDWCRAVPGIQALRITPAIAASILERN